MFHSRERKAESRWNQESPSARPSLPACKMFRYSGGDRFPSLRFLCFVYFVVRILELNDHDRRPFRSRP